MHGIRRIAGNLAFVASLALACPVAIAQGAGGLYVAGINFTFTQAVSQGLADNPTPGRFFVLAMPPATADLRTLGPTADIVALRDRAIARGAQFLVCRRDVASGALDPSTLIPGVAVVWGWPSDPNAPQPNAAGLFPGERASWFPAADELTRRIRSTCAS
jgi:hypothetical protein